VGIALAFGLTLTVLAYTLGPVSGGHFNPAVTIGLVAARRHPARDLVPYIVSQIVGAVLASGLLYLIASARPGWTFASGLGQNSYGTLSVASALVAEMVLTFVLVFVVLSVTDKSYPYIAFGGLAIGVSLLAIPLAGIGFSSSGVNPARSIARHLRRRHRPEAAVGVHRRPHRGRPDRGRRLHRAPAPAGGPDTERGGDEHGKHQPSVTSHPAPGRACAP